MLIKKNRIPVLHLITIGILPSFVKKFVYRLKGYRIGPGVKLNIGCVVIGKQVEIGEKSTVGFFTIIKANHINIGRYVKIGALSAIDTEHFSIDDDARINEQVYIGGIKTPESSLIMGKRSIIMQASYINPTQPIVIGDDSGIGGHCLLFTHGSWNSALEGYPVKFAPITIGKKVWLPWRVFVMPGVTIGDGAVVGADSLLTKDVAAHTLVAGSPAKVLKEHFPTPLTIEETNSMTKTMFTDFIAYLNYHGFKVEQLTLENGFELTIKHKSKRASITFLNVLKETPAPMTQNSILVVAEGTPDTKSNYPMVVSLQNRLRKGSTDVGEELVTFFSRYGVRFDRLD